MEDIIKRWPYIGFTKGLEGDKLKNVSFALEYTAQCISSHLKKYEKIQTIAFPIMRRIFQEEDKELNEVSINVSVIKLLNILKNEFKSFEIPIENPYNIDYEAEFCVAFSERYNLDNLVF